MEVIIIKTKITIFIIAMMVAIGIYNITPAHAYTVNDWSYIAIVKQNNGNGPYSYYNIMVTWNGFQLLTSYYTNTYRVNTNWTIYTVNGMWSTVDEAFNYLAGNPTFSTTSVYNNNQFNMCEIYTYKGTTTYPNTPPDGFTDNYDDTVNTLYPQDPTWYESLWDTFIDYVGNNQPITVFYDWLKSLWDSEEDDYESKIDMSLVTPAPTPTPIPYTVISQPILDPQTGDVIYYETKYKYEDNGTTIIATAPPVQPTSSGGTGGGGSYTPVGGDPFSIPSGSWIDTTINLDGTDISVFDEFGSGIGSINTVTSEYEDGIDTATNLFGTLPTKWLILIGVVAAIPLVAGIISRFLS